MAHMVAQQHLGIYDCIRSGTARTNATISAALATIGGTPTTLVLTMAGDGVWTISSNLTIPANVTLQIPAGVTVFRNAGVTLTIQGVVVAAGIAWETGPGTTVRTPSALTEISGVQAQQFISLGAPSGSGVVVENSTAVGAKRVRLYTENGAGGVGLQMSQIDNNNSWNWQMYANTGGGISWNLAGAVVIMHLLPSGLGLGPNNTPSPTYYLQLNGDFAAKPGAGGLWTVPSSAALKDVGERYGDGMALLRTLPDARHFAYNGLADTPKDQDDVGYVAEELQAVAPHLVRPYQARLNPEDAEDTTLQGVNLGPLLYVFVNALKELDARLDALEGGGAHEPDTEHQEDEPARPRSRSHRRRSS